MPHILSDSGIRREVKVGKASLYTFVTGAILTEAFTWSLQAME